MFLRKPLGLLSLYLLLVIGIENAAAQSITTVRDIDFGEAVVRDNTAQFSVQVNADGTYSADPEFSFVSLPVEGEYLATGLPAGVAIINITVTVDQQMLGLGEDFIIDNFDIDAPANADGFGELPISLGARLRTTGSGSTYMPATNFSSVMTLTVNY